MLGSPVAQNVLVSSFGKNGGNNLISDVQEVQTGYNSGADRRVSYNVHLSKDHAYHIIETD